MEAQKIKGIYLFLGTCGEQRSRQETSQEVTIWSELLKDKQERSE